MEFDKTDFFIFRDTIMNQSLTEIDQIVKEAKEAMEGEEEKGVCTWEYARVTLGIYVIKENETDFKFFEEIYEDVLQGVETMSDERRAEIGFLLFLIFQKNYSYTRCDKLLEVLKNLHIKHSSSEYIAFKYFSASLSLPFEYLTAITYEPSNYIDPIFTSISEYNFTSAMVQDLNFMRDKLLLSYNEKIDITQCLPYLQSLHIICHKTKSIYYTDNILQITRSLHDSPIPEIVSLSNSLLNLQESLLSDHPDGSLSFVNYNLCSSIFEEVFTNEQTEKATRMEKILMDVSEYHKLGRIITMGNELSMCFLRFSLEKDKYDHEIVLRVRKEFLEILNDETNYIKLHYKLIEYSKVLFQLFSVLGAEIDYKPFIPLFEYLKSDKLTFISFISSITTINDLTLSPYLATALEFCSDLQISKFHSFQLEISQKQLSFLFSVTDYSAETQKKFKIIQERIFELDPSQNDLIKLFLREIYSVMMLLCDVKGDIDVYVQIAQEYLSKFEHIEDEEKDEKTKSETFVMLLKVLIENDKNKKNSSPELALEIANQFVKYASDNSRRKEIFLEAIKIKMDVIMQFNEGGDYFLQKLEEFEKISLELYKEKPLEHANNLHKLVEYFVFVNSFSHAYKKALSCFDFYKEAYGSEFGEQTSLLIKKMAFIKFRIKEYEDAYNLIQRAKAIEEKVSSKFSAKYKSLLSDEADLKECWEANKKKNAGGKNSSGRKMRDDSKDLENSQRLRNKKLLGGAFIFSVLAIGAFYFLRNRKESS